MNYVRKYEFIFSVQVGTEFMTMHSYKGLVLTGIYFAIFVQPFIYVAHNMCVCLTGFYIFAAWFVTPALLNDRKWA